MFLLVDLPPRQNVLQQKLKWFELFRIESQKCQNVSRLFTYRRQYHHCTDVKEILVQTEITCEHAKYFRVQTAKHDRIQTKHSDSCTCGYLSCAGEIYLLVIVAGFYVSQRRFKAANLKIIYAISQSVLMPPSGPPMYYNSTYRIKTSCTDTHTVF